MDLLTEEAAPGGRSLTPLSPRLRDASYYSGTQGDLQIEMGLYGALIVLPSVPGRQPGCTSGQSAVEQAHSEPTFGLPRRPTTMPGPATTASTCSSSRRLIRVSTTRRSQQVDG